MKINTQKYIETFLKIKTKNGQIVPFLLNAPQKKLYEALKKQYSEKKPLRVIILKARQMGFSTLSVAIIFKLTVTKPNISSGIVAHVEDATSNLFNMSNLFYQELPSKLKPKLKQSNQSEIIFDDKSGNGLRSRIKCMTAGGKSIGRSETFQNLHISEYAFWPGDKKSTLAGLLQTVPNTLESMIIIESTANGYEDFKKRWDDAVEGRSDFIPVFCAWYELDEYRKDASGIILSPREKELKQIYNLDDEQISWRRWKIANDCGGDEQIFMQEFPSCPEEAFITSGNSVFDKASVIRQIEKSRVKKYYARGYFEYTKKIIDQHNAVISDVVWRDDPDGYITVHNPPQKRYDKKVSGYLVTPYVIGVDIAGSGIDYNSAKVVNNITKRTECTLHINIIDEDLLADQLYCLGKYYNDALIAVETNYSVLTNRELEKLNYPKIYYREQYDSLVSKYVRVTGFDTNSKTRPLMIGELIRLFRVDPECECDEATLKEFLSFVKNSHGRAEAENGSHDDLVIARAIANLAGEQQYSGYIINKEPKSIPFALKTEDSEEDIYYDSMFYESED